MSTIFFGSSDFSLPSLRACIDSDKVVHVISTPARKQGRGLRELQTPVTQFCLGNHIPVKTPESLKDSQLLDEINALRPDYLVVASYGKMIPESWLKIARRICLNVHPSILPKYRGASPINAPLLNGDQETGLSIAEVTPKLDAGDIFAQVKYPISPEINAVELETFLANEAYTILRGVLVRLNQGEPLNRVPQVENRASYAPKLKKTDGNINWTLSAVQIHNQVRALQPWPSTSFLLAGEQIQVLSTQLVSSALTSNGVPSTILELLKDNSALVATGSGALKVLMVKPPGKKEMSAADFLRGRRLAVGQRLSD